MKSIHLKSTVAMLLVLLTSGVLSSFAPAAGGYSFEIYLNNRLVVRDHLYDRKEVPIVALTMTGIDDDLSIWFNNCNKLDVSRKISLKDENDEILQQWTFADSPDQKNQMKIKVSDIVAFRNKHSTAKLMYSSQAVAGVHMVNIRLSDATALKK